MRIEAATADQRLIKSFSTKAITNFFYTSDLLMAPLENDSFANYIVKCNFDSNTREI